LLGAGEGGGFPAATRAVAERFAPRHRSMAMGIVNAGTAVGAVAASPVIAFILIRIHWLDLASWRWMFFITGSLGLVWAFWWWMTYTDGGGGDDVCDGGGSPSPPLGALLVRREVLGVVLAKFLSDGAWYFYLFWLPKYLFEARAFDLQKAAAIGWIPYLASGIGSLLGGWLSGWLLGRGFSVNAARKIALGASAALMPWVMLVPSVGSVPMVLFLFSLAFFGQQSWSTLIMTLPTDLVPRSALGKLAGLVGLGGAFGGIVMGQAAGWALDHGYGYAPVLTAAATLHLLAFGLLCLALPEIRPLDFTRKVRS
jgi:ACS family hexuronate transporter-like MFS transporter